MFTQNQIDRLAHKVHFLLAIKIILLFKLIVSVHNRSAMKPLLMMEGAVVY